MEIIRVCKKCGEVNTLADTNIIRADVRTEDNEEYRVMYYVCSRCNTKMFVQIDSIETRNIFAQIKDIVTSAIKKRLKGETVSPKLERKKDKLTKVLARKRSNLEDRLSGKKLIGKDEEIITKCLTFNKDGDIIESNL